MMHVYNVLSLVCLGVLFIGLLGIPERAKRTKMIFTIIMLVLQVTVAVCFEVSKAHRNNVPKAVSK